MYLFRRMRHFRVKLDFIYFLLFSLFLDVQNTETTNRLSFGQTPRDFAVNRISAPFNLFALFDQTPPSKPGKWQRECDSRLRDDLER